MFLGCATLSHAAARLMSRHRPRPGGFAVRRGTCSATAGRVERVEGEKCPLPEDPTLAALAQALNDAGQWAEITDAEWRCRYLTDEASLMYGAGRFVPYPVGAFTFGPEATSA